jgi:hypothetical protein
VDDLSWFDHDALYSVGSECAEILSRSEEVDDERRAALAAALTERCEQVLELFDFQVC